MKKIFIIGNSVTAAAAAVEIRTHDKESEISIFLEDHYPPYRNFLFGDFLAKDAAEDQLFFRPKEFYKEQNIQLLGDKKIARIDFKRNKITTEEKETFSFDGLLICDCAQWRFADIKGNNKTGIFGLRRLGDVKDILAILHLVETVAIQADCLPGLKMACGLKKRNKDVIFVCGPSLLSNLLDYEIALVLEKYLEENGIRIVKGNDIVEVLGDSDVKAIRLKSGKVIAVQSVILKEAKKDLKIYSDSGLDAATKIFVNESFKTNFDHVFAAGDISEFRTSLMPLLSESDAAVLESQGKAAGLSMLGRPAAFEPALPVVSLKIFHWDIVLAGKTKSESGLEEYRSYNDEAKVYQKVFTRGGRLVGAVAMNAPAQSPRLIECVKNQSDISALEGFTLVQNAPVFASEQNPDAALHSSGEPS